MPFKSLEGNARIRIRHVMFFSCFILFSLHEKCGAMLDIQMYLLTAYYTIVSIQSLLLHFQVSHSKARGISQYLSIKNFAICIIGSRKYMSPTDGYRIISVNIMRVFTHVLVFLPGFSLRDMPSITAPSS